MVDASVGPPWARWLGVAIGLVACREPPGDPQRSDPDPGTSAVDSASTDPAGNTEADTSDDTGPQSLDTGALPPSYPAPDCATLLLPGLPSDVAATPRPDHDAEVLALSLDPAAAVAGQARYEVISADLSAIRALDPTLASVHVGCVLPNGVAFWFFEDEDVNLALLASDYHAWDCHHQRYGLRQQVRIDGVAVAIELDGVYGQAVWQAYAALPGLGDQQPHWFQRDDWPVPTATGMECEAATGSIELVATPLPDGTLPEREYRFEHPDGDTAVYRVVGDQAPQVVG